MHAAMFNGLLLLATALLARLATGMLIRHARTLGVVQAPNERSFHDDPVPHGGGLGLVLAVFLAVILVYCRGSLSWQLALCVLGAGGVVAATGMWDDIRPLPARNRLAVQAAAALFALLLLGPNVADHGLLYNGLIYAISALLIVWWINLFNFMDGIDALAGTQCLYLTAIPLLLLRGETDHDITLLSLLLLAATSGFLWLNWPPARVFLGDVGSTFIGYVLAVLALVSVVTGQLPLSVWLILGGVFWVDATMTLLRRIIRAEPWHQAHRSHAYQRYAALLCRRYQDRGLAAAAARARAHRHTVAAVMTLNLLWLLPMAWLVIIEPTWNAVWLVLAWLPLVGLTWLSGNYE